MNSVICALLGALLGVTIAGVYVVSKGLKKIENKLSEIDSHLKKD